MANKGKNVIPTEEYVTEKIINASLEKVAIFRDKFRSERGFVPEVEDFFEVAIKIKERKSKE